MTGLGEALPWYAPIRNWLEPSWPIMLAIAAALAAVTLYLIWRGDPVLLAGWLVYLLSP